MDGLYDRDFLLWSEVEAEKLRRLRSGERVNDVDWENLIEEVESLGRSELKSVDSLLDQAIRHILKVLAWPHLRYVGHWRGEAVGFLLQASDDMTPAMRGRLSLDTIYRRASRIIRRAEMEETPPGPIPDHPWFTLDELLDENTSVEDLIARAALITPAPPPAPPSSP